MKKFLFLLVVSVLFYGQALAKHQGGMHDKSCNMHKVSENFGGGFIDTSMEPMSIAEVKKLSDDSYVVMSGHITKRLGEKKYDFSDGTDNIVIKIKEKVWRGQKVTPKDKITIYGNLDKDFTSNEINVKSLKIID